MKKSSFPHCSEPITISQDMCDDNCHMNVLNYSKLFIDGLEDFYSDQLGFTKGYRNSGFSSFTLEENIKYSKECLKDDEIVMHYRIHRINKKLIHLVAIMLNSNEQLCSIYETVLGHVDMSSRKVTEMEENFFENIQQIMREHTRSALEIPLRLGIKQL